MYSLRNIFDSMKILDEISLRLMDTESNLSKKLSELQQVKVNYFERHVPQGHYYSAVPSSEDENFHLSHKSEELSSIDLNIENQNKLLNMLMPYYVQDFFQCGDLGNANRFHNENPNFSSSDAIILNMMLRHFKPKNIIEVGSGFSTACILDTRENFFECHASSLVCIEPNPATLFSILKDEDIGQIEVIIKKLQEVDAHTIVSRLHRNDILFIDGSHVVKLGSDVLYCFNSILDLLEKGVVVHIHDIFYPFDYPEMWIKQGRHWNEAFFLKQFLAYNSEWEILLWPNMFHYLSSNVMLKSFPGIQANNSSSIYIRKKL